MADKSQAFLSVLFSSLEDSGYYRKILKTGDTCKKGYYLYTVFNYFHFLVYRYFPLSHFVSFLLFSLPASHE